CMKMVTKTRMMLYVEDIDIVSLFWIENFNAKIKEEIPLPEDFKGMILELTPTVELALFGKDFIKKYSPEVLGSFPSLMIFIEDFESVHAKISTASEIVAYNGLMTFSCSDPEGNYIAVAKAN
ncbi:MAG: glyoxalase, partial [Lactococcus sp.]|nr:glyoxalase [Lactococcus sp.]